MIDGSLDDPVWTTAPATGDFRQRDPDEGAPATEPTEVRILYDGAALYFGIRCHDSRPDLIRATELRRDDPLENDDSFSILLDTFRDRRNANLFRTNALGTQYDALITEEGRDLNVDWDEVWASEASIDEGGWTVEVRIPFTSLRSAAATEQTWGLNFERVIRRKNEWTYWSGYSRSWSFWNVSQAGDLTDLEEVRTGLRLRVKPYVLGGFSASPGDQGLEFSNESDIGLEDLKVSLSPSITGDLTINPDFAQTEVDAAQINLTRFTLFYPEKRQFFLEGADIFRFGTPPSRFEDIIPELLVFHSRRVGLSPEGTPIPILAGGKVTGKHRGLQFAGLNAQTLSEADFSASNLTALRAKQSIFARSYIGAVFTNKYVPDDGYYNRVAGLDTNFVLFDKLTVSALASKSQSRGKEGRDFAWMTVARWTDSRFDVDLEHAVFEENYDPELGFLRRGGVIRDRVMLAWKPRPDVSWIRQLYLASGHQWFESYKGFLESRDNDTLGIVYLESGDSFGVEVLHDYEYLDEPFAIHPDVEVLPGSYTFTAPYFFATAYPGRRVSGGIHVQTGGFYDGSIFAAGIAPLLKLSQNLSVELAYDYNDIELSTGRFNAQVFNSRFNLNFTNKWLTSATVRYDNVSNGFLFNLRLNYIYRPGDDFFIVYNEQRDFRDGNELVKRELLLKLNHSFDF